MRVRSTLAVTVLLLVAVQAAGAESHGPPPNGLRDLGSVEVVTSARCGYNEVGEVLQGMVPAIEKQLAEHGIGLLPAGRPSGVPMATLVIDVSCSRLGMDEGRPAIWPGPEATSSLGQGRLIYFPRISLTRQVQLVGASVPQVTAETWSYDQEVQIAQGPRLSALQATVRQLVAVFISCYESVNDEPRTP